MAVVREFVYILIRTGLPGGWALKLLIVCLCVCAQLRGVAQSIVKTMQNENWVQHYRSKSMSCSNPREKIAICVSKCSPLCSRLRVDFGKCSLSHEKVEVQTAQILSFSWESWSPHSRDLQFLMRKLRSQYARSSVSHEKVEVRTSSIFSFSWESWGLAAWIVTFSWESWCLDSPDCHFLMRKLKSTQPWSAFSHEKVEVPIGQIFSFSWESWSPHILDLQFLMRKLRSGSLDRHFLMRKLMSGQPWLSLSHEKVEVHTALICIFSWESWGRSSWDLQFLMRKLKFPKPWSSVSRVKV